MSTLTTFEAAQSETDRLAFLLSCYDVWSASRPDCGTPAPLAKPEDSE